MKIKFPNSAEDCYSKKPEMVGFRKREFDRRKVTGRISRAWNNIREDL